jgi:hypothetical protein
MRIGHALKLMKACQHGHGGASSPMTELSVAPPSEPTAETRGGSGGDLSQIREDDSVLELSDDMATYHSHHAVDDTLSEGGAAPDVDARTSAVVETVAPVQKLVLDPVLLVEETTPAAAAELQGFEAELMLRAAAEARLKADVRSHAMVPPSLA